MGGETSHHVSPSSTHGIAGRRRWLAGAASTQPATCKNICAHPSPSPSPSWPAVSARVTALVGVPAWKHHCCLGPATCSSIASSTVCPPSVPDPRGQHSRTRLEGPFPRDRYQRAAYCVAVNASNLPWTRDQDHIRAAVQEIRQDGPRCQW